MKREFREWFLKTYAYDPFEKDLTTYGEVRAKAAWEAWKRAWREGAHNEVSKRGYV